jgi:carbon monoxide dehydrogenase subunit G
MKLSGTATLHGPVEHVYATLNDPAVLVRTIPGCQRLEQIADGEFRMVLTAGVASIKGTYQGEVRLTDQRAPHSFVLKASGSGGPGTVSAAVNVSLAPADGGTTVLSYDADAVVGGMIGGVGQRMLTGVAKKTAEEFFAAVDGVLTGQVAAPVPTEEPAGAVFTRPPSARPAFSGSFAAGVLAGAAAALAGVLVGYALRPSPRRASRSGATKGMRARLFS